MAGIRIYVGGLSSEVDNELLKVKFSRYGIISTIDLKDKKDAEGKILTRFAYLSINATHQQINKCIDDINGTTWMGSILKVEKARESFMERLQRERTNNASKEKSSSNTLNASSSDHLIAKEEYDAKLKQFQQKFNKSPVKVESCTNLCSKDELVTKVQKSKRKKRPSSEDDASDSSEDDVRQGIPMFQGTCNLEEEDSELDNHDKSNSVKTEEKMLLNFKNFSDVWGDLEGSSNSAKTDACGDYGGLLNSMDSKMKKPVSSPFVKLSKDINFSKGSSTFSFLDQFSKNNIIEDKHIRDVHLASDEVIETSQNSKNKKSRLFFIDDNDAMLIDGANWMAQEIKENTREFFIESRPEIVEVCKTKVARLKQALSKNKKNVRYQKKRWINSNSRLKDIKVHKS